MKRICLGLATVMVMGWTAAIGGEYTRLAYDCEPLCSFTVFGSAMQRWASLKNDAGIVDTRFNPTAGGVGLVYKQGDWRVGASFSYEAGTRKYSAPIGSMRVDSDMPGITLFGGYETPTGWYADASGFAGFGRFEGQNYSQWGRYYGNSDRIHNTVFAAGLEGGKKFDLGGYTLTPHVGVDYSYTPEERYTFGGPLGPTMAMAPVAGQSYWEIPVGVSFGKTFLFGNWAITPKVDATLVNAVGHNDNMNTSPGFAYLTDKGWKVGGIGGDHFGARLSAGVKAMLNQRTEMGLDYTYEGRSNYNDHRLSAVVGWSF